MLSVLGEDPKSAAFGSAESTKEHHLHLVLADVKCTVTSTSRQYTASTQGDAHA